MGERCQCGCGARYLRRSKSGWTAGLVPWLRCLDRPLRWHRGPARRLLLLMLLLHHGCVRMHLR